MPEELTIKAEALEPLFAAWGEPDRHRVRADSGQGAVERKGRRPSGIAIAQNLRTMVKEWRDNFHFGASKTTWYLLNHWFERSCRMGMDEIHHVWNPDPAWNEAIQFLHETIRERTGGGRDLLDRVKTINEFRNTRVAHQEQPLNNPNEAKAALVQWVDGLTAYGGLILES